MTLNEMTPNEQLRGRPAKGAFLHIPVPWVFVLGYLSGPASKSWHPCMRARRPSRRPCGWPVVSRCLSGSRWRRGVGRCSSGRAPQGCLARRRACSSLPALTASRATRCTSGLALAYLGETGALPASLAPPLLVLVLAYVNWCVVPVEEASLKAFREYGDYCSRVRRWL